MKYILAFAFYIGPCLFFTTVYGANSCLELFQTTSVQSAPWFDRYASNEEGAVASLLVSTKKGKRKDHRSVLGDEDYSLLNILNSLREVDFSKLSLSQHFEIYKFYRGWNLIPPQSFRNKFAQSLVVKLPNGTEDDFIAYAQLKKTAPMEESESLALMWKQNLVEHISSWSLTTQLEVLSAELYRFVPHFSLDELEGLLLQIDQSLKNNQPPKVINGLKDLYRGVLFAQVLYPELSQELVSRLREAIDQILDKKGFSLNENGRSGTRGQVKPNTSELFLRFKNIVERTFPDQERFLEYSETQTAGLFDPVDIFIPSQRLIIEWDGLLHFFNPVTDNGIIDYSADLRVLRPLDQIKDRVLRMQGYRVLRVTPDMKLQWLDVPLSYLIEQQNPQ